MLTASAPGLDGVDLARLNLIRAVEADEANRSMVWLWSWVNVLFNVAAGLVLGLGFQHWESAAWNTLSGILISEVQLLTTPHGLRQLVRPSAPIVALRPMLGQNLTALALGGTW